MYLQNLQVWLHVVLTPMLFLCVWVTFAPISTASTASDPAPNLLAAAEPAGECVDELKARGLTLIVPFSPGGGKDLLARQLADFLESDRGIHVLVQNIPGAMGTMAAQSLLRDRHNDLAFMIADPRMLISAASMGLEAPLLQDLSALLVVAEEPAVWIVRHDALDTLRTGGRLLAASSETYWRLEAPAALLQRDLVPIRGYRGSADTWAALARGEIDLMAATVTTARRYLGRDSSFAGVYLVLAGQSNPLFPSALTLPQALAQTTGNIAGPALSPLAQQPIVNWITQLAYSFTTLAVDASMPADHKFCLENVFYTALSDANFRSHAESLGISMTLGSSTRARQIFADLSLIMSQYQSATISPHESVHE